jgi:hypothetical protein
MDKVLRNSIIGAMFIFSLSVSYYFVVALPKEKQGYVPKKDDVSIELRKAFDDLGGMIKVDLCKEAYIKYVTEASKERKGFDNFQAHCQYRSKDWSNFEIQNIVFSGDSRADIRYSVDIETADFDSVKFKECSNHCFVSKSDYSCLEMCEDAGPRILKSKEWIETWIFEEGLWKRDY